MSATGRGKVREANDFYSTPAWCVARLFEHDSFIEHLASVQRDLADQEWLEPCVGDGAIIDAVKKTGIDPYVWDTVDVVDNGKLTFHGSFLDYKTLEHYDVCLTNPPYNLAQEIIEHAFKLADVVVMLLRVNFLGSEDRHAWWQKMARKPDIFVLPNRPVFTTNKDGKPGVDATEYAWFVWGPKASGRWFMLDLTSKEERGEHSKKVVAASVPTYKHAVDCEGGDGYTACTCLPALDDLFEILDSMPHGRPQLLGELYKLKVPDAPSGGCLAGSGTLAQKRVSTHEQLAAVVQELV